MEKEKTSVVLVQETTVQLAVKEFAANVSIGEEDVLIDAIVEKLFDRLQGKNLTPTGGR